MVDGDSKTQWALHLLSKHGATSECEAHGYLLDNLDIGAVEAAKKEAVESRPDRMTPREAEQAIDDALQNAGLECPGQGCSDDDK